MNSKKSYKRWKFLTHKTDITVDPETSMIFASASQSQHSSRQRREQLINEQAIYEESDDDSDADSGNVPATQVPKTQEEKEVYRVSIIDDETQQVDVEVVHNDLGEAHKFLIEVVHQEIVDDNLLKQPYKTLLLIIENSNDKVFNNFVLVLLTKMITMNLKRQKRYSTNEDKLQLLEAMTGVSRNNQDVPKQLGQSHSFGSPHSGGLSSGSPSFVGTNLAGRNSPGFWGLVYPQWSTPPNTPQWGTPPNCSAVGNTTKCFAVWNTTKCSTVGHTTKYCAMWNTTKLSTRRFIWNTRRFIWNDSNKCSIWILTRT
ncbi:hypothetical protein AtNW77_Chr3g0197151 [Arabidopsis thaliana]